MFETVYRSGYQVLRLNGSILSERDWKEMKSLIGEFLENGLTPIALSFESDCVFDPAMIGHVVLCSEMVSNSGQNLAVVTPDTEFLKMLHHLISVCQLRVYRTEDELVQEESEL